MQDDFSRTDMSENVFDLPKEEVPILVYLMALGLVIAGVINYFQLFYGQQFIFDMDGVVLILFFYIETVVKGFLFGFVGMTIHRLLKTIFAKEIKTECDHI
jgi:hypothetical protein